MEEPISKHIKNKEHSNAKQNKGKEYEKKNKKHTPFSSHFMFLVQLMWLDLSYFQFNFL